MTIESTPDGLEARLRPRGIGRFFGAAFLSVWLCGWAAGEVAVLSILAIGTTALLIGRPIGPFKDPLELAPALVAGLFLFVWLSLWTLGGWAALRQLLNLLWAEDRILARPDALEIRRRIGPFRSTTRIARDSLIRIDARIPQRGLSAETMRGLEPISNLGTAEERMEVETALRAHYGLDEARQAALRSLVPPTGWAETIDVEGQPVLVKAPAARRVQARVAWGAAFVVGAIAVAAILRVPENPGWLGLAAIFAVAAGLLAWGAWRLTMTRLEWRLGSGEVTLRRRTTRTARDLFEGRALELTTSSDSDGDLWYTLSAIGAPPREGADEGGERNARRTILHLMRDPVTPRRLGAWIAQKTGMHLDDRAASEPGKTWDEALTRLRSSGRLGRWIASRLPRP